MNPRTHAAHALHTVAAVLMKAALRLDPPAPILAKAHAQQQLDELAAWAASRDRHPSTDHSKPSGPALRAVADQGITLPPGGRPGDAHRLTWQEEDGW